jgi:hypothetical protein
MDLYGEIGNENVNWIEFLSDFCAGDDHLSGFRSSGFSEANVSPLK